MCLVVKYALIHVANLSGFYPNKYKHHHAPYVSMKGVLGARKTKFLKFESRAKRQKNNASFDSTR